MSGQTTEENIRQDLLNVFDQHFGHQWGSGVTDAYELLLPKLVQWALDRYESEPDQKLEVPAILISQVQSWVNLRNEREKAPDDYDTIRRFEDEQIGLSIEITDIAASWLIKSEGVNP